MRHLLAAALLAAAPLAGWPDDPPAAGPSAVPAAPVQLPGTSEVTGTVRSVDWTRHRVVVETADGTTEFGVDRNTLVYQPAGATTVLDIVPGATLRAGLDPSRRAFWVQLRAPAPPRPAPATTTPDHTP